MSDFAATKILCHDAATVLEKTTLLLAVGKNVVFLSLSLSSRRFRKFRHRYFDDTLLHSTSFNSEEKITVSQGTIDQSKGSVVSHSLLCHEKEVEATLMPGATQLLPGKNFLKHMYPMRRTLGALTTTSVQKKQGNNEFGEGEQTNVDDKIEPIVAFSKPPPLPPVLGPFIVFSLLEMGSDHDGNDN